MATYTGVCFTTITVYTSPAYPGTLATIYSDAGLTTPILNPFPCFGNYTFYGAAGLYVMQGDFTRLCRVVSSGGSLWAYRANTSATSGYPGDGRLIWDNATQTSAANLIFAHITADGLDIDILLGLLTAGITIILQDEDASGNNQIWTISGAPVNTNPGTATSYWTIPVTLSSSAGTGTTGFSNNHQLIALRF